MRGIDSQQIELFQPPYIMAAFLKGALASSRYESQISCLERVLWVTKEQEELVLSEHQLQELDDVLLRTLCTLPQVVLLDLEKKAQKAPHATIIETYLNRGKRSKRLWSALLQKRGLDGFFEGVSKKMGYNVLLFTPVQIRNLAGGLSILQKLQESGVNLLPRVDVIASSGYAGIVALLVAARVPVERIVAVIPQIVSFFYVGNLFPRGQWSRWKRASKQSLSLLAFLGLSESLSFGDLQKKVLVMVGASSGDSFHTATNIFENFTKQGGEKTIQEALTMLLSSTEKLLDFQGISMIMLPFVQKYLEASLCDISMLVLGARGVVKGLFPWKKAQLAYCIERMFSALSLLQLENRAVYIESIFCSLRTMGARKYWVHLSGKGSPEPWENGVSWVKKHMLVE